MSHPFADSFLHRRGSVRTLGRRTSPVWVTRLAAVLAGIQLAAGGVVVAIESALAHPAPWVYVALFAADLVVIGIFAARVVVRALRSPSSLREPGLIAAVGIATLLSFWSLRLCAAVVLVHDGVRGLAWLGRARGGEQILANVGQHPARTLVLSFAALSGFGAFLLSLPAASAGPSVRWVDALFTAVSATCVTGLTTLDTASTWSVFGQGVLLVLIQTGGLGIMTIAAFMTLAVGRELGLRRDAVLSGAFDEPDAAEMRTLVKAIVLWTLTIELAGALALLPRFAAMMPVDRAVAFAVFHSVSAFCNAGFALFSDNLVRFVGDPLVVSIIGGLALLGGLGFGVLVGVTRWVLAPRRTRLSLNAKVVLFTSALLVWAGGLSYFVLEYDGSLAHLGLGGKLLAAFFQSAVARTAGFNMVAVERIQPATALVLIALMFVGASPGSTGGGIKTTTFAIAVLTIRALVAERAEVEVFGRRLPQALVARAFALAAGAAATLIVGLTLLCLTEELDVLRLMFEAASALGTVGLSMGATGELSDAGRIVVSSLMFLGRVGPLTALGAAALRRAGGRVILPEDRLLVG